MVPLTPRICHQFQSITSVRFVGLCWLLSFSVGNILPYYRLQYHSIFTLTCIFLFVKVIDRYIYIFFITIYVYIFWIFIWIWICGRSNPGPCPYQNACPDQYPFQPLPPRPKVKTLTLLWLMWPVGASSGRECRFVSVDFQWQYRNESTIAGLDMFFRFCLWNLNFHGHGATLQEVLAALWAFTQMALGRHSHAKWSCGTWAGKCSVQHRRGNWYVWETLWMLWTVNRGRELYCNLCFVELSVPQKFPSWFVIFSWHWAAVFSRFSYRNAVNWNASRSGLQ